MQTGEPVQGAQNTPALVAFPIAFLCLADVLTRVSFTCDLQCTSKLPSRIAVAEIQDWYLNAGQLTAQRRQPGVLGERNCKHHQSLNEIHSTYKYFGNAPSPVISFKNLLFENKNELLFEFTFNEMFVPHLRRWRHWEEQERGGVEEDGLDHHRAASDLIQALSQSCSLKLPHLHLCLCIPPRVRLCLPLSACSKPKHLHVQRWNSHWKTQTSPAQCLEWWKYIGAKENTNEYN